MSELSVPQWDGVGPYLSWEERVAFIAFKMAQVSGPPKPSTELFENGFQIRVLTIPAQTFIIGRKHRKSHRMVLSQGSAIMCTEAGKVLFTAPFEIDTQPGFQSVAYTIEDCIVYTMYKTDSRDSQALEAECFEPPATTLNLGRRVSDKAEYYSRLNQSYHSKELT